jgi:hypothetical protein
MCYNAVFFLVYSRGPWCWFLFQIAKIPIFKWFVLQIYGFLCGWYCRLSQIYAHPDDVDFFVGGMSEKPVSGGLLGWTFLCVVGDQFARAKKGDRFFYDVGGQPGSFSEGKMYHSL